MFILKRHITKLRVQPPKPAPDRKGVAVCVIFKNEADHISEWAQFHLKAGVTHFLAYDDNSQDGTVDLLKETVGDRCTVIPWSNAIKTRHDQEIHNQVLAYAHAIGNFGSAYRWMAFIDVDEFLFPQADNSLDDALDRLKDHTNVSLPWHMFGRSGQTVPPAGGTVRNFTQRYADQSNGQRGPCNFKVIVDPCKVTEIGVHAMKTDGQDTTVNDMGKIFKNGDRRNPDFFSNQALQLNHYYTRSDAELQDKLGRGVILEAKTSGHSKRVMRIVDEIERVTIEDRAALDFLDRVKAG